MRNDPRRGRRLLLTIAIAILLAAMIALHLTGVIGR
jgi:hypothetical protein